MPISSEIGEEIREKFHRKYQSTYRLTFIVFVAVGAFLKLDLVWALSDCFNGLMAFPNLVALLALSPVIIKETRDYFSNKEGVRLSDK